MVRIIWVWFISRFIFSELTNYLFFQPEKSSEKLFRKIESAIGAKIPGFIKTILFQSGFDCDSALKQLNEEAVIEIEQFIETNKAKFVENLKDYDLTELFKFLPGHRRLILSLPKYIEIKKTAVTKKINKPKSNEKIIDGTVKDVNDSVNDVNNLSKEIRLKKELIRKINTYAKNKQLPFEIDDANIFNFRLESNQYKCKVKCPFCDKKLSCLYITFWSPSNLTKHINKIHVKVVSVEDLEKNSNLIDSNVYTSVDLGVDQLDNQQPAVESASNKELDKERDFIRLQTSKELIDFLDQ